MTTFYCFADESAFLAAGGRMAPEYTQDGVGYSVLGAHYESPAEGEEPSYIGFLVNTTEPVSGWPEVSPTSPMRVFG